MVTTCIVNGSHHCALCSVEEALRVRLLSAPDTDTVDGSEDQHDEPAVPVGRFLKDEKAGEYKWGEIWYEAPYKGNTENDQDPLILPPGVLDLLNLPRSVRVESLTYQLYPTRVKGVVKLQLSYALSRL